MKKLLIVSIVVGMLISAGGCGGPLVRPNITNAQTYNAPYDKVWAATVQTFIELSSQVSVIEKDSGFIATVPHVVDYGYFGDAELRQYVVCPDVFCAIWTHLRLNGNALVTAQDPNQTVVKLTTNISAYNRNEFGGGGKWYIAYSKGAIERNYLTAIREKLKADLVFGGTFDKCVNSPAQQGGQGSTVNMTGSSTVNSMAVYGCPVE